MRRGADKRAAARHHGAMDKTPVDTVLALLAREGGDQYGGEAITQREHALQAATLAREAGAPDALVAAALLHDVGHLIHRLGEDHAKRGIDDRHEALGAKWLARWFEPAVTEPIRWHVEAKRYLCAAEPGYFARLSEESVRSLALQGGVMDGAQAAAFAARPEAQDAVRVRRWDEEAKIVGWRTPGLDDFRPQLETCLRPR